MSTLFYDRAVIEKLKSWTSDTNLHIYGPDDARHLLETIADETNDSFIELPILCLVRDPGGYDIQSMRKKPLSFDGFTKNATYTKSEQLNAIPIGLSYRLDIYTRYYDEADDYCRNLIFNIINFPMIKILIPYNDANIEHESNIFIAGGVQDNSSIPERIIKGQFTRLSIPLTIQDAYLFDYKIRNNIHIIDSEIDIEGENYE